MKKQKGETAIEFANRVKSEIAHKGGLVDLEWDGQLKRQRVKPELLRQQQLKFSKTIELSENDNSPQKESDDFFDINSNQIKVD